MSNFKDFLSSLENRGGMLIIFPEEKMNEVRNNMIRAYNNKLCLDVMTKAVIFPILKDSETANELIKIFSPRNFPLYIFCKYKNEQKMTIKSSITKKFWMKNVVDDSKYQDNTLLGCFPDNDIKNSIFKTLTETLIIDDNIISKISESDEFSGSAQEQSSIIINLIKQLNNSVDTLRHANHDNSNIFNDNNNSIIDEQLNNGFLNVTVDERNIIKKITFDDNKLNQSSNEETEITQKKIDKQNLSKTNINVDLLLKQDYDNKKFSKIKFKYPNGKKYIEKEFDKTEKVISLFNFVKSLGRDIYSNQNSNTFELIHDFPPKNLMQGKNNTLIEEGLFPTSMVSIIEK